MTQLWKLAKNDIDISAILKSWTPFHYKSFTEACFSGVGRQYKDYIDNPQSRLINSFPIVPQGKEFIESFNNTFKNIRINLLYEGPPLDMDEEFLYYTSSERAISTIPIALDITFTEDYLREIQWYLMIPLLQFVRGFGPRYAFYKKYAKNPLFEDVVKTSSALVNKGKKDSYENIYGLWSLVPISIDAIRLLDSPDVVNHELAFFTKSFHLPYGSTICRTLNDYTSEKKKEERVKDK